MTILEAIRTRHSVRAFTGQKLDGKTIASLNEEIGRCNTEGGLHIQLVTEEPEAFGRSVLAKYGKFSGVENYIALVGRKSPDLEERVGYYGERIFLYARTLGLDGCWVGLTYKKVPGAFKVDAGEKLVLVIAIGYAAAPGKEHKIKSYEDVTDEKDAPEWFRKGVEAALLAPTAMNQQKFKISLADGKPVFGHGWGSYVKTDLGIVKYHFEVGSTQ